MDRHRIGGRERRADEGLKEAANLMDALPVTDAAEHDVLVEGLGRVGGFQVDVARHGRECVGVFSIVDVVDFLRSRRRWLGPGNRKRHFRMRRKEVENKPRVRVGVGVGSVYRGDERVRRGRVGRSVDFDK